MTINLFREAQNRLWNATDSQLFGIAPRAARETGECRVAKTRSSGTVREPSQRREPAASLMRA